MEGFHSDGVHDTQRNLPVLTSMYCLEQGDSDTLFACGRTALKECDEATKALARRLRVHYLNAPTLQG